MKRQNNMANIENTERKVEYVGIAKKGPSKKAEMIFTGLTFIVAVLLIVFAIVPKTLLRVALFSVAWPYMAFICMLSNICCPFDIFPSCAPLFN